MLYLRSDHSVADQTIEDSPSDACVAPGFGQLSLRTILVIVFVVAVNLAVFQRFSPSVGMAAALISMALTLHLIASHFAHRAMHIGNAISDTHQPRASLKNLRHVELFDQASEDLVHRFPPATDHGPRAKSRGSFYFSGCLGIVAGPWTCFELMSRMDADVAHPLAILAIFVAGALLGIALFLSACAALRLMSAALQSLR